MHIQLTTEELDANRHILVLLPEGTSLVELGYNEEYEESGWPIHHYEIKDGGILHTMDVNEHQRKATEEELEFTDSISRDEVVDRVMTSDPNGGKYSEYQVYMKAWRNYFNLISCNGYYPETNQRAIKICMYHDAEEADLIDEINYVLDKIIPISIEVVRSHYVDFPEDYGKLFGIMDDDLSKSGIIQLWCFDQICHPDDIWIFTKTVYGSTSEVARFNTIEEVASYIKKHHIYGNY